ncbi:hypothetical protein GA840_01315 [Pediococcus ethanolidurans]|uniref:hypothetical protein n=1 Tax=Pediococcus ethanolidurans TaxID=319653 RepID=UPI002955267D|nr:hypothetical protein [Pediococcus ethanolidurans]MDV7718523.1 hypothetical protein [Pediococcus ethanolidurans]
MPEKNRTVGEVIRELKKVHIPFTDKDGNPLNDNQTTHENCVTLAQYASFLLYKNNYYQNKVLTDNQIRHDKRKKALTPKKLYNAFDPDLDFTVPQESNLENKKFNNNAMFLALNISERPFQGDNNDPWFMFHMNPHDKDKSSNHDESYRGWDTNMIYSYLEFHEDETFEGCYITDLIKETVESNSAKVNQNFFLPSTSLSYKKGAKSKPTKAYYALVNWQKNADNASQELEILSHTGRYNLVTDTTKKLQKMGKALYKQIQKDKNKINSEELQKTIKEIEKNRDKFEQSAQVFHDEYEIIRPKHLIVLGKNAQWALLRMLDVPVIKDDPELVELIRKHISAPHYSGLYSVNNSMKAAKTLLKDYNDKLNN